MNSINSNAPFDVPSVVFSVENDFAFKNMAEDLASKFEGSLKIHSNTAGHHLPLSDDPAFTQIKNFIIN